MSDRSQKQNPRCDNSKTILRRTRRMVQLLSLALWLGLFLITRGPINELIRPDLFLLTDPLVAAVSMGAARVFVPAMFASLGLVLLTLIFGRAFCGWICPLGTLIDGAAKLFDPPEKRFSEQTHEHLLRWKYWILAGVLVAAIFSCQLVFLLDPLVLTFRATAAGLYPVAANLLPRGTLDAAWAIRFSEIAFAPLALLIAILALTAITPRFYCRYLCPLGALYALISRVPLLRRRVSDDCDGCDKIGAVRQCVSGCRMGAVPINPRKTRNHECIRCMTGRSFCHAEAIRFDMRPPVREKQDRALDVGRRGFMVSAVAGLGLAPVLSRTGYHRDDPRAVIRPPRVLEENTFLDQCVRCGMCVQACPSQTLQLVWLESGLNGLWSPAVTPRIGGCVPDCNACSLVCPTEAIPPFGKKNGDKWVVKMGTAIFEAGLCISYTELQNCSKCIRICPTKALILDTSPGQHPERPVGVDFMKCMGCGLCEWECIKIVYGAPAIVTSSHGRGQPTVLR